MISTIRLAAAPMALCATLAAWPACAQETPTTNGPTVNFVLQAASDYVWRGLSQTDGHPAVFATVTVKTGNFYAGASAENVRFSGIHAEYDAWAGYVANLGPAKLDLGVIRYAYVDAPANIDTLEGKAALSGNVGKLGLTTSAFYTRNYFGTHRPAFYTEAAATLPVPGAPGLTASATYGRQQIDALPDYTTWNAGLDYAATKALSLGVRFSDSTNRAAGSAGDGRVVGSATISF